MLEKRGAKLISRKEFLKRIFRQIVLTAFFVAISLLVGVLGYHIFEGLSWLDSFLNASMILGGMGEVSELKTNAGKIFASLYALYSGIFLIVCGGLLLAPLFHRILHHFHSEGE